MMAKFNPPPGDFTHVIQWLNPLVLKLKKCKTSKQKLNVLKSEPSFQKIKAKFPELIRHIQKLEPHSQVVVEALLAIGAGDYLFKSKNFKNLKNLINQLIPLEKFYHSIGGILGYHLKFLELLTSKGQIPGKGESRLEKPPGMDISKSTPNIREMINAGIQSLPQMAEIYPVAGAADRLDLHDEKTGEALPAAELRFGGYTLIEGLIRDLEAREYLYYKMTGKKVITPIVLMTSEEKNNHYHVRRILEKNNWFGRPKDKFFFIIQPLVPVITGEGKWHSTKPFEISLKPGGHGVIWKVAKDQGAFKWLKKQKRSKAIIRQINNPIAGLDYNLLAFSGLGCKENRSFGFMSCERFIKSTEGMDVLIETKHPEGYEYKITNIEYTDFERKGIEDIPEKKGSLFSRYPANTNILFADLHTLEKATSENPLPGLLINLKAMTTKEGNKIEAGRLEAIMQNVADSITICSPHRLTVNEKKLLPTFILYNKRSKTIAVTKKSYSGGKSIRETPEGTFFTLLENNQELLVQCGFKVPKWPDETAYIKKGPSLLFTYHPALGPLYSVIQQKLKKGIIHEKSELKLDISELEIKNLDLKGSLLISAKEEGKCVLRNVRVENKGLSQNSLQNYWKYALKRNEALEIILEGNGEFYAENVTFKGNQKIIVPKGHRVVALQDGHLIKLSLNKIDKPTWSWSYCVESDQSIKISN